MFEVIDVSSRILTQTLKIEREYLSQMNSTSSHEMRNPLNAIKSQIIIIDGKMQAYIVLFSRFYNNLTEEEKA